MTQMILTMTTVSGSVRSEAIGWGMDDSSLVVEDEEIGMTPSPTEFYQFDCVLRAMHAGWKLLAPPVVVIGESADWLLVKEAEQVVSRRRM